MMIEIDIETYDRELKFDMAGVEGYLTSGTIVEIPGGLKVKYDGALMRKAFGFPEVLQLIVDASTNVELGLLAAWLYDKANGKKVETITINRKVVTLITRDGILQVLEEEIKTDK
ncbi:hypothetical protein [Thiocapsa rosea]|uniref:hypothetical protein n=1 Tax=Thiocapsa rosea TaxID=69360 RepID=UPI0011C42413|nr:hypothetical protein [Thiocapsa rosea]